MTCAARTWCCVVRTVGRTPTAARPRRPARPGGTAPVGAPSQISPPRPAPGSRSALTTTAGRCRSQRSRLPMVWIAPTACRVRSEPTLTSRDVPSPCTLLRVAGRSGFRASPRPLSHQPWCRLRYRVALGRPVRRDQCQFGHRASRLGHSRNCVLGSRGLLAAPSTVDPDRRSWVCR